MIYIWCNITLGFIGDDVFFFPNVFPGWACVGSLGKQLRKRGPTKRFFTFFCLSLTGLCYQLTT